MKVFVNSQLRVNLAAPQSTHLRSNFNSIFSQKGTTIQLSHFKVRRHLLWRSSISHNTPAPHTHSVSISRMTSSQGWGWSRENTTPRASNYLVMESTKRLPGPSDLAVPGTVSLYFLWPGETGDYKYSFLSLPFWFGLVLWDRVSCYLGCLKCTTELRLALIPDPPTALPQFWDYSMFQPGQTQMPFPTVHVCVFRVMCVLEIRGLHTVSFSINLQFISLSRDLTLYLELTKLARLAG